MCTTWHCILHSGWWLCHDCAGYAIAQPLQPVQSVSGVDHPDSYPVVGFGDAYHPLIGPDSDSVTESSPFFAVLALVMSAATTNAVSALLVSVTISMCKKQGVHP